MDASTSKGHKRQKEKGICKIAGRKSKEARLHDTTGKKSKQEYRKGCRATRWNQNQAKQDPALETETEQANTI